MKSPEEELIRQATVSPHWLADGRSFWYLRHESSHKSSFDLVDIDQKIRGPVFDHKDLAKKLQRQTGREICHNSLPFAWIEVPDTSHIRFLFSDKKWQYGPENILKEIPNDDSNDDRLLDKEVPSKRSCRPVYISMVNHHIHPVQVFWIHWDGEPLFHAKVEVGATEQVCACEGYVWRIVDDASGETLAIYSVPNQSSDELVIRERTNQAPKPHTADEKQESPELDNVRQSKRRIFVSDDSLWLQDTDGTRVQLAAGNEDNKYDASNLYLSPDSQFAVAWQFKPEQEHLIHLVESSPPDQLEPKLKSIQYLKPGDRTQESTPRLFDLDNRTEVMIDKFLFANHHHLANIGWSHNSQEYRFIFNERGHQHLRVLSIHLNGRIGVVVEESSSTFIDYSSKMYCWAMEGEMIWSSERDGYNHLYLVDLNTGVKAQITRGEWNVRSVDHIDESRRRIWLKVLGAVPGQDPYYAYPAYVNFDGTEFTVLVKENGTHFWSWSPDKRYLVDSFSRVDQPPKTRLLDGETGEEIMFLEGLTEIFREWTAPEIFVAPGRDATTPIHGIIIRPSDFDESKSYPVIEDVYAGPQDFFAPKSFSTLSVQQKWANDGYIVVQLDGMGTNWRSKAFHDVCYKNLKDGGLPDRIAWIKAAASTRPWMDISRVGIFGGSAGGQNAAAAVLHYGDFYKAAAADCGCHDNRMDKLWWNEQWMGHPVDESYAECSNVTHATKLKGALMLIVGGLDTNVDPSSTMQLVHALNEADKEYELLYMPLGGHVCGRSEYGQRRQRAFFKRHLAT
ncbi:hypothetical protein NM208_g4963 [Fusarium decemcellulare]|uniref:Uncharacterized protein n=1 Tax=Fusarium decemcellulare TaxID=57161 RepID=A0ACC1SIV8_9HYPO|nr:hypothetical protein NM208_g4963 [Fusarium decemcellulare]